ncbi:MAG: hypothetical protein ACXW2T_05265 [Allosphingosinicella sp.]
MRRELLVALAAFAVASPPVIANPFSATRADPLVCKHDRDTNLGSHFRAQRTCMQRSAWRELEERTQSELQQIMDGQTARGSAGNGVRGLSRGGPT